MTYLVVSCCGNDAQDILEGIEKSLVVCWNKFAMADLLD
jgi:hypothetical protein